MQAQDPPCSDFGLPSARNFHPSSSESSRSQRKSHLFQSISSSQVGRFRVSHGNNAHTVTQELETINRERSSSVTARSARWWKVRLFRGMVNDIKRRAPYYWSDWTDAWDYRVVPATVYMYFAKYGPTAHLLSFVLLSQCFTSSRIQCTLEEFAFRTHYLKLRSINIETYCIFISCP
jgi:HCO3- transporter family.